MFSLCVWFVCVYVHIFLSRIVFFLSKCVHACEVCICVFVFEVCVCVLSGVFVIVFVC